MTALSPTITSSPKEVVVEYTHADATQRPLAALLQIAGALVFASYFFFWIFMSAGLVLCVRANFLSATGAVLLSVAYIGSLLVYKPQRGKGWPYRWFLHSRFVDLVLGYHGSTCIREGPPLDPTKKYLFAMSPHGVFGVCRAFSGGTLWRTLFPGIGARWGSFGAAFVMPGVREFSLCCGCLDASRSVLQRAISRGENVILLPGGEKEMLLTDGTSRETQLVLLDRKGFVRLAVENGMDLVPGFCFGEKWVHDTVLLPKPLRTFLYKRFRLAGCVLRGRWWTFLGHVTRTDGTPLRMGFVWGKALPVRQIGAGADGYDAYVDEVHAAYVAAVQDIFARHKERFGYAAEEQLVIVSAKHKP